MPKVEMSTLAKKMGATYAAIHACRDDDGDAFERALSKGADLRGFDSLGSGSLWDHVVARESLRCFAALLPHVDLLGSLGKERMQDLSGPGSMGPMMPMSGKPGARARMLSLATAEALRQAVLGEKRSIEVGLGQGGHLPRGQSRSI